MKKQSEDFRRGGVGFSTPKKGKSFKQAKLAVSGRKLKIYEGYDSNSEASAKTAATMQKKGRGRPTSTVKRGPKRKVFPQTNKRKAKTNASSVISHLFSNQKIRGPTKQNLVKENVLFYL